MKYTSFLYAALFPWTWLTLHVGAAVGAVVGGVSAYSSYKQGKKAEKMADRQADAVDAQMELAWDQWNMYRDDVFPLEQEARELGIDAQQLAVERYGLDHDIYKQFYAPVSEQFAREALEGVEPEYQRVAREARADVMQAFDVEEGMRERDLARRGVRPGSGQEAGALGDTSLARAATSAMAVNRAREAERDRAQDVGFNRMATALGRQPVSQAAPTGFQGSQISPVAAAAAGRTAAAGYGSLANRYASGSAGTLAGGMDLAARGYDLANQFASGVGDWLGGMGGGGTSTYQPTQQATQHMNMGTGNLSSILGPKPSTGYAEGGPVEAPPALMRPNMGGEVNGPPGRDQVPAYIEGPGGQRYPARLQDEEYVIPADVVRAVGTNAVEEFIASARNPKGRTQ